jgi:hypothetical protein
MTDEKIYDIVCGTIIIAAAIVVAYYLLVIRS